MLGALIRRLDALFDFIVDACAVAAGVLIFLTMIGTSADVLSRYFLNRPIEEMMALSEFALLYITFLSAPWLLRINGHIQMDFFVSRMGIKKKSLLEIVSCTMGMFICLILIWYGTQVSRELWVMKVYDLFKMKGFPKAIIVAIIPFGSVLLFFQFLKNLLKARKLIIK
jgi:C4-dicarboxylate transporter DctQ subunit